MQSGIISQKDLVLVITRDSLVVAVLKGDLAATVGRTRDNLSELLEEAGISGRDFWEVSALSSANLPHAYLSAREVPADLREKASSIRSRLGLETAPWLRYASMTAAEILAESPESRRIALQEIRYVRGEDLAEDRNAEDLLVIRTPDREERYRLSSGSYYTARVTLISLLENRQHGDPTPERIISIVPACFEPGPKDFDFQYVFNLIFTDWRLIMAVTPGGEDEVERRWDAFMESIRKKAKQEGISPEAYSAGADWKDAPWQEFRQRTFPEIFDSDGVNFFIPYTSLTGVTYKPGRKSTITLSLPSHTLTLEADPLFAPGPLLIAQAALRGVLSITL